MNIKSYTPFYKENLLISIPIILSNLGQVVVQLVDTMMVGHLGANELAAASFASAIFTIGLVFSIGAASGITPIVGNSYSKGLHRKSSVSFQNSILLNTIIALSVGVILFCVSFFMKDMGQTKEVIELAMPYFRVLAISIIPFVLFLAIKQFLEGIGNTKISMYITIFSNLLNIILNYLLIYGKLGLPELGMIGAAYSTLIARCTMPIIFLIAIRYKASLRRYFYFFHWNNFSIKKIKSIARIGFPIAGQMLVEVAAFSLSAVMMGWFGAISLAGHQIAMNLSYMTFMIASGIASGTTIRVSHAFGDRSYKDMRKTTYASIHITLVLIILSASFFILLRHKLPYLFTSEPQVVAMASQLMIIAAIYQLSDGLQIVALGALRGMSDVKRPMVYAFISYLGINIPIAYILAFKLGMGPIGIWVGFVFGLSTAAILFFNRFNNLSNRLIKSNQKK